MASVPPACAPWHDRGVPRGRQSTEPLLRGWPRATLAHRHAPAHPGRTARRRLGAQHRGMARYAGRRRDPDRHRRRHQRRLLVRQASGRGEGHGADMAARLEEAVAGGEPGARLRDVYWIGGGNGAGKSTIARRLAARHGLRLYATDDVMADHGRRSSPADSPFMAAFAAMDMDERWVSRSPQIMLETFGWFRGEGFGLIVEDLLRRPAGPGVIAEGFRLLPRLVRPLLAGPGHAVWLCPTQGFRRAAFASRGSLLQIAGKTSDPDTALANLLERDGMFTDRLREEATGLGLPVIDVDTTMTEDELTGRVARAFGLS